jgi:hypothetical protein
MATSETAQLDAARSNLHAGPTVLCLLAAAAALAYYGQLPPAPVPATAPATEFSAERALTHIREVAKTTHGAGSRANDAVRQYIFDQLRALGLDPQIQKSVNAARFTGVVENVLARIPGTGGTKAFAMEAHYDSVPYGPGATDDCGGVGAMLETARAIKAGPPLKNDVILVFSDMEEINGYGVRAFLEHPWAKDIGVELGFEARGTSGPSYMFETSKDNGWLIAEMIKAGVQPRATSMMYGIYNLSPFASDFTAFKRAGYSGFNVAFVDDFCYYHTRDDRPDVISLASIQHHGAYALGFARHFGNIPLDHTTAPDAIYFNTLGSHMVAYPLAWGRPFMAAAAILLAIVLAFGLLRRHLTVSGLFAGIGVFLLCAVVVLVVIGLLTLLVYGIHGRYLVYHNKLYGAGLLTIAVGVMAALYRPFRRRVTVQNLAAGALVWWLVSLYALQTIIPGGSYLALWPLIFGSIGLALLFLARNPAALPRGPLVFSTLFAVPGIFLFVPSLVGMLAMGTLLFSAMLAVTLVFLYGLALPQTGLLNAAQSRRLSILFMLAGAAVVCVGLLINVARPATPHFDCLSYGLDLDQNRAYWLSNDKGPDEWTRRFIPPGTPRDTISEFIPRDDRRYLKAPAPIAPTQGPSAVVVSDETADGKRTIALRLSTPEAVTRMRLRVLAPSQVFASTIMGKPAGDATSDWERSLELFPRDGADLTLTIPAAIPLQLNLIEMCYGLPDTLDIPPRPAHLITEPNTTLDFHRPLRSEHTFVCRTFTFPPPQAAKGDGVPDDDGLRMNQIQVIGTHNSYHQRSTGALAALAKKVDSDPESMEYSHAPLDVQLDRGVRSVELDVHNFPDGFQVYHVPHIDQVSTCRRFVDCLGVIRAWSEKHPGHVPISILVEPKDERAILAISNAQPIDAPSLDRIDAEIRSVFPPERLITPDDVRGHNAPTLEEAVRTNGWPPLGAARGKVFFILHVQGEDREAYVQGHPSLEGRAMFVRGQPGQPYAATLVEDHPDVDRIQRLVKEGYIIRTRADAGLRIDPARRDRALATGAQIVSTDFPNGEADPKTGYVIELPEQTPARPDPVNAPPVRHAIARSLQ